MINAATIVFGRLGYTAVDSPGLCTMRRSILLLPACLAFAAISGCGNKGPLYMPPPTPAPAKPAPKPAPAHASTVAQPAISSSVVTKPLGGT
jgi:predicted small lipoprotein YifL